MAFGSIEICFPGIAATASILRRMLGHRIGKKSCAIAGPASKQAATKGRTKLQFTVIAFQSLRYCQERDSLMTKVVAESSKLVMRGLDPRIHQLFTRTFFSMDCRVQARQ